MFLRRIAEGLKSQDWPTVVLELVIVVLGVFLGLQAQQWNESRRERLAEEAYLVRLGGDFAGIDNDLGRCLAVYRDGLDAIDQVRDSLAAAGEPPASADAEGLAEAMLRMTANDIPAGRSATFLEMLSSGDLGLLQDPELRDALVAYDERAQVNRAVWRALMQESSAVLAPVLENVTVRVDLEGSTVSSLEEIDARAIAYHPGLRATFNALAASKSNLYELCRYQRSLSTRVRDRLGTHEGP